MSWQSDLKTAAALLRRVSEQSDEIVKHVNGRPNDAKAGSRTDVLFDLELCEEIVEELQGAIYGVEDEDGC